MLIESELIETLGVTYTSLYGQLWLAYVISLITLMLRGNR